MALSALRFGDAQLLLTLPEGMAVDILEPLPVEPAPDPALAIAQALDQPIGTPRLEGIARFRQRVAVMVDDITRPTPVHLVLPAVLERLARAGINSEQVTIVLALGTHRPMTNREIDGRLGPEIAHRYPVVNADAFDPGQLRDLGRSALGIAVQINRHVVDADLRVAIGNIVPHSS